MQMTETKGPQLVRPGPIGLGIRVILGATVFYWFAALLTCSGWWRRGGVRPVLPLSVTTARLSGGRRSC
jgi:hypothetical protein